MLAEPAVETSVEGTGREASVDTQPRHATRSTINGRADVNYSVKYHPMDEVTRPKRAARITGSRPPTSFADTSDEEEPELSDGESSDDEEPSESSDTPTTRAPDPRAVRHSSRAEAQKQVNYSNAHHPQDWAIQGLRRSAKRKRRSLSSDKPQKKTKKQAAPASPIALSSDMTSDSDSDDDDEDDEPPASHRPTDPPSPSRSQAGSPDAYHVDTDDVDAQCPKGNSPPPLPRGESSSVSVDAIIEGSHITQRHRSSRAATEQSEPDEPNIEDPETDFAKKSTAEIGDAMSALMDGVATPNATISHSTGSDHATPDVPMIAQPPATMPTALVTPASMAAPNTVCTQAKTQRAINRQYMATQPNPSHDDEDFRKPDQARPFHSDEDLQKPDQARSSNRNEDIQNPKLTDSLGQPSFKVSTASVRSTTSSDPGDRDTSPEEQQDDGFSDASRQAMRDASEQAARTARAKDVTHQLSSGILSQTHTSQRNGDSGSSSVSRQVSRDTLPDQPDSSFFEAAMAGAQTHSQPDHDDDSQGLFNYRFSELPFSERECSDTSASQEQPSSNGQHSRDVADGVGHHPPIDIANAEQPGGSDQPVQHHSQSSTTLPKSTDMEDQDGAAGKAAALTLSEDSRLLEFSGA